MFTAQAAGMVQQLIAAGMDPAQASVFGGVLGQCMQRLEHRGPVDLAGPLEVRGETKFNKQTYFLQDVYFGTEGAAGRTGDVIFNSTPVFNNGFTLDGTTYTSLAQLGLRKCELTSAMSGGSCSFEYWDWTGAAYAKDGDTKTGYDICNCYPHAASGDRGFVRYDDDRGVYEIVRLNTRLIRTGVLNTTDLAATSLASPSGPSNVTVGSTDYSVYGVNVPTDLEIVHSATTYVTFYYDFDASMYIAISTNTCATTP